VSKRVRRARCPPRIISVAHFLIGAPFGELATLEEVDRRWPSLSLRDLRDAAVFAAAANCNRKGRA